MDSCGAYEFCFVSMGRSCCCVSLFCFRLSDFYVSDSSDEDRDDRDDWGANPRYWANA